MPMHKNLPRGQRSRRSISGSTAIEFAIVAPFFLLFLFGIIETGVIFFLDSTLQNATQDAARLVRTGQAQSGGMTKEQFIAQICSEMNGAISSATCNATLQVDMRAYSAFSSTTYQRDTLKDGSLNPKQMEYETGSACSVVLVRTYYPWTIMTPFMQTLLSNMPNGQYLLNATAAFRNEPYLSGQTC